MRVPLCSTKKHWWWVYVGVLPGSISSTSPTAGPADVLIHASPPHRRARSAAWSYHFYPDEAWVDLTVSLPCAVLLKEVHIQPHLTSLASEHLWYLTKSYHRAPSAPYICFIFLYFPTFLKPSHISYMLAENSYFPLFISITLLYFLWNLEIVTSSQLHLLFVRPF